MSNPDLMDAFVRASNLLELKLGDWPTQIQLNSSVLKKSGTFTLRRKAMSSSELTTRSWKLGSCRIYLRTMRQLESSKLEAISIQLMRWIYLDGPKPTMPDLVPPFERPPETSPKDSSTD